MISLGRGHDWIPDGVVDGERVHRCDRCATLSTWAGALSRCSGGGRPAHQRRAERKAAHKARLREQRRAER